MKYIIGQEEERYEIHHRTMKKDTKFDIGQKQKGHEIHHRTRIRQITRDMEQST